MRLLNSPKEIEVANLLTNSTARNISHKNTDLTRNIAVVEADSMGAIALTPALREGVIYDGAGHIVETYTYNISDPDDWILISYSLDKVVGNTDYSFTELCDYLWL